MKVPFVDLGRSFAAHAKELSDAILEVAASGVYVSGENVASLENAAVEYLGTSHAVAVASGTDALHLAIAGLGIVAGDEVITTPFTFAATVEAIEYVGAQPILVDIDEKTYNISADCLEDAITDRSRAILPVHLFGLPADMPSIVDIAQRHDLVVIEDCAQSFGASLDGRLVGSFGHAGAHSFYPTKTLGCFGDGGLISTSDPELAGVLRELRNHGVGFGGEHVRLGFNSRLDELQASILRIKLAQIDAMNYRRQQIAAHYNDILSETGAITPTSPDGANHVYGYYTILVNDRDALRVMLDSAGVSTALYYAKPLHKHAYFSKTCRYGPLPVAEHVASNCLSLPLFPEMTDAEVAHVATATAALLQ